jgi:hypothetical protein
LTLAANGKSLARTLIADTGAGSQGAQFQLILDEDDCLLCGGSPLQSITLGGAYVGSFPSYGLAVRIPALSFDQIVRVVGVSKTPLGFDGIACFGFLNQFTYGNLGDGGQFGLEC